MKPKNAEVPAPPQAHLEEPAPASDAPAEPAEELSARKQALLLRAAEQALQTATASPQALAGRSLPRWLGQAVTARWPPLLGSLLKAARLRKGFSQRKAAQRLEQRLQEVIASKASVEALRAWEEKNSHVPAWLLVAYLEALEAPIEEWLRVLVEFADASGDPALRERVVTVSLHVEKSSKREKRELLPTIRHWVEQQAGLVGAGWSFQLIGGALAELVPDLEPAEPVQQRGGMGGLVERFAALEEGISALLRRDVARSEDEGP